MKVLLVSHRPNYIGGIASWTKRMFMVAYDNVNFVLVDSSPINRDAFKDTKVSIKDELYRSFKMWKNEAKELKSDKEISIVHTNIPCTLFGQLRETITAIIAKIYRKKFVLHCHCTVPNVVKSKLSCFYFKHFIKLCDGIIVLNEQSRAFVAENGARNVKIIPNFVMQDDLDFNSKRITKKRIENAVYIGGVTSEKGCSIIVEAAKKCEDITFHLVGLVSEEIEKMEKTSNIKLYGNVNSEKVKKILRESDVFLFLSRFYGEGFSCALTEAMAAGLPCIVSDWAANRDMIENKGGVVIEDVSGDKLAKTIKDLSISDETRTSMSTWNREKVSLYYTDSSMKELYADFYQSVLE